jgi:hypothetical protein
VEGRKAIEKKHALASSENLAALPPVFRSACNKEIPVGSVQLLKGAWQTKQTPKLQASRQASWQ